MTIIATLERAAKSLASAGLTLKTSTSEQPILSIVAKVSELSPDDAMGIARVLQQSTSYNEMVMNEMKQAGISNRYEKIVSSFDSIREDLVVMVGYADDGKIDVVERAKMLWMRTSRGSVPERFEKIKLTFNDVMSDTKAQTERETAVQSAYADFREAMKGADISAQRLLRAANEQMEKRKAELNKAQQTVTDMDKADGEAVAKAELVRDQAMRAVQEEEHRLQIAIDLANNIKTNYAVSETVMAKLLQFTTAKQRVFEQAVTFFGTNDTSFTALALAFTSQMGLAEATNTMEAMKDGVNKSLETLADLGNQSLEKATRAGYGPNYRLEPVKKLVDSVVAFQQKQIADIDQLRKESAETASQIFAYVEEGKAKVNQLVTETPAKVASAA